MGQILQIFVSSDWGNRSGVNVIEVLRLGDLFLGAYMALRSGMPVVVNWKVVRLTWGLWRPEANDQEEP